MKLSFPSYSSASAVLYPPVSSHSTRRFINSQILRLSFFLLIFITLIYFSANFNRKSLDAVMSFETEDGSLVVKDETSIETEDGSLVVKDETSVETDDGFLETPRTIDKEDEVEQALPVVDPAAKHPDEKYFYEIPRAYHLDARYGLPSIRQSEGARINVMTLLLKSYTNFCLKHQIETWIAHGCLIGLHWNAGILPWDDDLDVQMSIKTMFQLAELNQTFIERRYLLDVNPNMLYREHQDQNVIDARYIDTWTGMFIDITALASLKDNPNVLACKSPHYYHITDIYPLQETIFQGVSVLRPNNPSAILVKEYGAKVLTQTTFNGYQFDQATIKWKRIVY